VGDDVEEREIELIDYLNAIWKWKMLIFVGTMLATGAALVLNLPMHKTYESPDREDRAVAVRAHR